MTAHRRLTEEEAYLAAILQDDSGIDIMEFLYKAESSEDGCFRARPYQKYWWWIKHKYKISAAARDVGKSMSIIAKAAAFPYAHPGHDFFLSAPSLDHLRPLVDKIEEAYLNIRILRELLLARNGKTGISRIPSFQAEFKNGAKIVTRIPKTDGRGVRGQHALKVIIDECFPADTMVLTSTGHRRIVELKVGDMVWTHMNRWRPVTAIFDQGLRPAVKIRGMGHPGLITTADHKLWVRPTIDFTDRRQQYGAIRSDEPEWLSSDKITKNSWWSAPIGVDIALPDCVPAGVDHRNRGEIPIDETFAEFLGWYLAEGSTQTKSNSDSSSVTLSIRPDEVEEVAGIVKRMGLRFSVYETKTASCVRLTMHNIELVRFLNDHCGMGAKQKRVPVWVFGASEEFRGRVLVQMIRGDGHWMNDERYTEPRFRLTTVSKAMALGARMLAESLGYSTSIHWSDTSKREVYIRGRRIKGDGFFQLVGSKAGTTVIQDRKAWSAIRKIEAAPPVHMYDIAVEEDHSFVADGIFVHNCQDYPDVAITEIFPTLRSDLPGASMEIFGVTSGLATKFDELATDPDSLFTNYRKIAPERETWGDEERQAAIKKYKGATSIDFGRNVFGISSGVNAAWYVTARLMACVRVEETPWAVQYNRDVYKHIEIHSDSLEHTGRKAADEIIVPASHLESVYASYWAGMDVGLTNDPSEILIFGQYDRPGLPSAFRLLCRITMKRVSAADQIDAVKKICTSYGSRMRRLAMDGTGLGLPIYQILSTIAETREPVRGYGFSEKLVVGWEDRKRAPKEKIEALEIKKKTPDHGLDVMRGFIDEGRLELPMDVPLLTEWQGVGEDHTLHAGWMFGVAVGQHEIDAKKETMKARAPVLPIFG